MSMAEDQLSASSSWKIQSWINVADNDPPPLPDNYENGRPAGAYTRPLLSST
jgi:hypothetical protein